MVDIIENLLVDVKIGKKLKKAEDHLNKRQFSASYNIKEIMT